MTWTPNRPLRIATYARVSTDQQTEANQQPALDHYAAGFPGAVVVPFVDHGVSGTKTSRPAFDRLMGLALKGQFDRLVFWKLDRLGRNTEHLLKTCRELEAAGVTLVSLNESIDTSTAGGKAFLGMLAVFAQFERDTCVERTKAGLRRAAAGGPLKRRGLGTKPGPVHRTTAWRRSKR